jgi:hypothetical protein
MYHSGKNPLRKVSRTSEEVPIPKGLRIRRLHKAFLRYHDADNWPMLRAALQRMGRSDLIGSGPDQLVPAWQPKGTGQRPEGARAARFTTQHLGLPRVDQSKPGARRARPPRKHLPTR